MIPAVQDTNPGPILPQGGGGAIAVEQQRALAVLQVQAMLARANPRDEDRRLALVLKDCEVPAVADLAIYEYARGGTEIRGASIKLVETIARRWGNIACGIKELARVGGYSECMAYALDLETGFYDERTFQVRHWRDTNRGGFPLRDERDIYELVANMGQRRKRAVLLSVLPPHAVHAAMKACESTVKRSADLTPNGIAKLLEAFAEFKVTREQIEARLQRKLEAMTPAQYGQLRKVYASLRDGIGTVADFFAVAGTDTPETTTDTASSEPTTATQRAKEKVRERQKATKPAPEPDPFKDETSDAGQGDGSGAPEMSMGRLHAALVAATSKDDADLVMDAARQLPEAEQQALRIVYDQRFGDAQE